MPHGLNPLKDEVPEHITPEEFPEEEKRMDAFSDFSDRLSDFSDRVEIEEDEFNE